MVGSIKLKELRPLFKVTTVELTMQPSANKLTTYLPALLVLISTFNVLFKLG